MRPVDILHRETLITQSAERVLVALLLAAFSIQGAVALHHMSATGDETHYLGVGRYLVRTHQWNLDDALLHPPLSYYLHSIPLLFFPINDDLFKIPDMNARGRALMALYADDRVLMAARAPILLLGATLGFLVFYWARQAYGTVAGLMALWIYAFNPVLISNAAQITPDLCLAFFSTLTIYLLWRYLDSPTPAHLAAIGAALGLTLLSKYSGVLVIISMLLIIAAEAIRRDRRKMEPSPWRLRHVAVILLTAFFVVNAGYFFQGSLRMLGGHSFKSRLFQGAARTGVFGVIPSPLPAAYVAGLDWQHTVVEDGFGSFLLGEVSRKGWTYFYAVAFFLKTPAPLLLLLILAGISGRRKNSRLPEFFFRPEIGWVILVPVLIFPLYFSAIRLSRGIRYVLPIYPLLCVWVAQLALNARDKARPLMRLATLSLLLWYAAGSLWIAPHYLAYFNEIGGGPGNGVNLLFESDFDWGQELKELGSYLRDKNIPRIKLAYFSTADPAHYGITFDPLPCEKPPRPTSGLIAVSATVLQVWGCQDWLKAYQPVDKVGYTMFIYDIPPQPQ